MTFLTSSKGISLFSGIETQNEQLNLEVLFHPSKGISLFSGIET